MFAPGTTEADPLDAAANALKTGDVKEARRILQGIIAKDPYNKAAWELVYQASNNDDERIYSLNAILKLDPDNLDAFRKLAELKPTSWTENTSADDTKKSSPSNEKNKNRNRSSMVLLGSFVGIAGLVCVVLWAIVFYRWGIIPFTLPGDLTRTAQAASHADCQKLIDRALAASSDLCNRIGSDQACYGNNTVNARLIPGSADQFSAPGNIIGVNQIESISASVLDPALNEWGIAIFKVISNLPRSLPGETITLVVFGNTTLENSGSLETYYFYSGLGKVACDQIPFDGLMVTMPEGTGIHFVVNGSELTLMGNASLKAEQNGTMDVSLYSGAGIIESDGQQQIFTAGQSVSVTLDGLNGTESYGPPSTPAPLSPDDLSVACSLTGTYCDPSEITPVPTDLAVQWMLTANAITPSRAPFPTFTASSTATPTPTRTLTRTSTPSPTGTRSPSATATRTSTGTRTTTATRSATHTSTPIPTGTPTPSFTPTHTPTPSLPNTETNTPADTPPTSTDTFTPTDTFTSTPGAPVACDSSQIKYYPSSNIYFNIDELNADINNDFGSAIKIIKLHLEWPDSPPIRLDFIQLDVTYIWDMPGNQFDDTPPSDFAISGSEFIWDSSDGARTINTGGTKTLLVNFDPDVDLPAGNYALRVTFGGLANCYIDTSITK